MIHNTQNIQISQKQDEHNIYAVIKTMCPPGYHHNGFVATHTLGHMMYHCGDNQEGRRIFFMTVYT